MHFLDNLLGLTTDDLTSGQMAARAFIIFVSLVLIRIAGIRTLGKQTAFDTLTLLMLGSIMGRSIVTGRNFFGSIAAALIIMALHRFIAWVTYRSKKAGVLIKGKEVQLIKAGKKNIKNLRATHITDEDLNEVMRSKGYSGSGTITDAYLERSGEISILNNGS